MDPADEIIRAVRRHLPGRSVGRVIRLGQGTDNIAYEIDHQLIVRRSREADPARRRDAVQREAALLAALANLSPLPVPELVFADEDAGIVAYGKLPGRPLMEHPLPNPAGLALRLGEFLSRLHAAPVATMATLLPRDPYPLAQWRHDAERDFQEVARQLSPAHRRLVEDFLAGPIPLDSDPGIERFCHNDLGAEHILVDPETQTVTGVIDWTDAAITDPARDLGRIYRDLGPEVLDLTLSHYEAPWDATARARAVFYARCTLLEDLKYGLETRSAHHTRSARSHLPRTFA